jgi:hypothetical protein
VWHRLNVPLFLDQQCQGLTLPYEAREYYARQQMWIARVRDVLLLQWIPLVVKVCEERIWGARVCAWMVVFWLLLSFLLLFVLGVTRCVAGGREGAAEGKAEERE